jgi:hypothetical protein
MDKRVEMMVEKGAHFFCDNRILPCYSWNDTPEKAKEHYRGEAIRFLFALNIIGKCGECGGTGEVEPKFRHWVSGSKPLKPCPFCFRGHVAVEDKE